MNVSRETINSFDKNVTFEESVVMPDNYSRLIKSLTHNNKIKIPRGAGLSYSPAAMTAKKGIVISTEKFNRVIGFDPDLGKIKCEPGISIGQLLNDCLKYNWYLPVLPGYPSITLGGCVAFNVHGKSQFHSGNFIECIEALSVFHPNYGEIFCSRTENENIFFLTVGGMGLTGFITEITLKLKRANFHSLLIDKKKCLNIFDSIDFLEGDANKWDALYSWHNFMLRGESFGKGIIYCEKFDSKPRTRKILSHRFIDSNRRTIPFNMVNNWTAPIINGIYAFKDNIKNYPYTTDMISGSFPIYGKEIYFKMYGRKGFLEYQLILPRSQSKEIIKSIQKYIYKNNQVIGLASLKLFEGKQNYLNFCDTGICLALDVPNNEQGIRFFSFLDNLCMDTNSIMNISKDSRLFVKPVKSVYRHYQKFKEDLLDFDPSKKFSSIIRERLDL